MLSVLSYLLLFVAVGVFFVFIHLVLGKLIRPNKPDPEKMEIYECGEPTVGSAWVQFDLRYYVIALLFVIFDVEVAFFFPWATVFGKLNALSHPNLEQPQREEILGALIPPGADVPRAGTGDELAAAGRRLAWIAFVDILVFFGVLLVGYAYLWRRGDLDWVRSTEGERVREKLAPRPPPELTQPPELVGARQAS
jgi:NADH-quinone oxidoreductase subunit A